MHRRFAVSILLAILSLATTAAAAQQPTDALRKAVRDACMADLKTVCAGVTPGEGRIAACAKANFAKLSPPCQQALIAAKKGG